MLQMPKGYAYMELADEDTAQIAMKMSGVQFMGRKIKVLSITLFVLDLHASLML